VVTRPTAAANPPLSVSDDRVLLRRSTEADAGLIARTLAENLEHLRGWMAWAPHAVVTAEGQCERIRATTAAWEAGEEYVYLILPPTDDDDLFGNIGLHRRISPKALEIGYWLAERHVGHGYATAAVALAIDAALSLPDVDRVEIRCDETNLRSAAIPQRLGFRLLRVDDKVPAAPLDTGRNQVWALGAARAGDAT